MTGVVIDFAYRSPLEAFAPFAGREGALLFDSAAATPSGERPWTYLCVEPRRVVCDSANPFATLADLAAEAKSLFGDMSGGFPSATLRQWPDGPPFTGGVAGWLSYESGRHLERCPTALPDDVGVPETAFGLYDVIVAFDTQARRAWVLGAKGCEAKAQAVAADLGHKTLSAPAPLTFTLVADQSQQAAEAAIQRMIDAIWAGDILQANVTQRLSGQVPEDLPVWDLYRRLRRLSPAPFAAMASFDGAHLLSASPERFLSVAVGGHVESRPIKGTRPRGQTALEDAALAEALCDSGKDRAENLMIVDLLRNDLSKVCALGSVTVRTLCGLETFASVHHLVSVIQGRLAARRTPIDLLKASFPGGSVTGAPKIHAMALLREVESCRRGLYCGSLFWLGANGAFDSSILIRSLVVGRGGRVAAQAGGGIVAESDPRQEYHEARVKIAPLIHAASGPFEKRICEP